MFDSFADMFPARKTCAALAVILVLLCTGSVQAQPPSRNLQREAAIERELETAAPGAVATFRAATAAMDAGRHAEAVLLFQQVVGEAPRFSPVVRRIGYCLVESGKREEASDRNLGRLA